jgi:hypothetical protein
MTLSIKSTPACGQTLDKTPSQNLYVFELPLELLPRSPNFT